jgi:alkanesulfonate monooxygenase SsuD/methylene tetrahydromethanopterin reductase-like flavin-dependent oxidoreductase (luciferase family)
VGNDRESAPSDRAGGSAPRGGAPEIGLLLRGGERSLLEAAVLAESLGFAAVWLGEPPGAPPVLLAAIAACTSRVRLGWLLREARALEPLRIAEATATLDGLSDGRAELAVDASGATQDDDAARLREGLSLLRQLWTESELSWSGRFWPALDGVTLEPRPVQRPHPPLWLAAGATAEAAELAGSLGLPLLLPAAAAAASLAALAGHHRDSARGAGHGGTSLGLGLVSLLEIPRERIEEGGQEGLDLLGFSAPDTEPTARSGTAPRGAAPPRASREILLAAAHALGADRLLLSLDLGRSEAEPQALRARLEALAASLRSHLGGSPGSASGSLAAPGAVR